MGSPEGGALSTTMMARRKRMYDMRCSERTARWGLLASAGVEGPHKAEMPPKACVHGTG